MPAFSRSQVSAVMPSLRSRCFWTFCGRRLGQRRHDADVARHHEVGHARDQEVDQLGRIERAAVDQRDRHQHLVLGELARHGDDRRLLDRGMGADLGLDLERGDVLAAPADRVLHAVDEEVVAVLVDAEGIAGVEPAVAPGPRRRLGILVVAVVHRPRPIGAHDQLADLAGRHLAVVLVDDPHLDAGTRPAAGAERRRVLARQERRRHLGHVEDGVDVAAEARARTPPRPRTAAP